MEEPAKDKLPTVTYPEWGRADFLACVLSVTSYFCITAGMALLLLNRPSGYVLTAVSIVSALLMYKVIDPKLKSQSEEFEKKQKGYLEELDRILEWEELPVKEGQS